jgi:hypothetical protein
MNLKQIILVSTLTLGPFLCLAQIGHVKKELGQFELKSRQGSQFYVWETDKLPAPDASKGVIIENSFPKGGRYTDSSGKESEYRIFWYRVINKTGYPLELTINFSAFTNDRPPDYHVKFFVPLDTMTVPKEILYNYGVTGLESFLEGFNKPPVLQRSIKPEQECFFYIGAIVYPHPSGVARASLTLQGQDLLYKITGISPQLDSLSIPCGHIVVSK